MYALLCLALLGSAAATPVQIENPEITDAERNAAYVLPRESFPTFYDVRLFIDPGFTDYFFGNVSIRILPSYATNQIVMQAMEIDIDSISVYTDTDYQTDLFNNYTLAEDNTHFLRIYLNQTLTALQPITVHISYTAQYAPNMFGVYISTYPDTNGSTINLVTSQLQPTFARRAFPCYDEPAHKAVFRTTIYAPPAYAVVRSNMPLRNGTLQAEVPGWTKHEFDDTPMMSSYLLAYLVSNFEYIDNTNNPLYHIPFRVYSRPGTQTSAEFALDFGQKNMVALEDYINFRYLLPKLDKVAVPDFAAGAMENWGLVVYREVALLVREGVTTTNVLQNIGRIICHENVHQWFGNEVSPFSWTYTWLNEGFANFFESFATDLVLPEWRMMDQFVIAMQNVFQSDAVVTVNPMTFEVFTPSEILGTFNSVAYQKSGSVIRMMQHFLTPEVFRDGLSLYIRTMSRQVASPANLYSALQEALNRSNHTIPYDLITVMTPWTTQGGFPVLNVRRSAAQANSVFVSQERFLTDRTLSSGHRWHVPVNWVLSTNVDFSDTAPQAWVPPSTIAQSIDIPGLSNAVWFIFNKQQTGYYRVNYNTENWEMLAQVLATNHQTINVLNRAQLLDDSFNLARNGRLNYSYAFILSTYLIGESDYIPWAAANAAFATLDTVLSGTATYSLFQEYLLHLSAPLYATLGFNATANEEHVTPYHRNIILNLNCQHGNQDCVDNASQLLQNYMNNPNQTLNPDIQTTVFCSGLRGGNADNFNFLWGMYVASQDSSEQSILLNALGCTSNPELREFYLSQVISNNSLVREQDRHTILVSVINSSPENLEVALNFVMEHFTEIQPRVQGLTGTTNILNAFARRLTSNEHSTKIDQFYARYENDFTAGELASVDAIRENIAAAITWNEENLSFVDAWLRANFGSNANGYRASVGLVLSFALYNILF